MLCQKIVIGIGFILCTCYSYGQYPIRGKVIDAESHAGIPYAAVRLIDRDSVFITGVATDSIGNFCITTKKAGIGILDVSSMGYVREHLAVDMSPMDNQELTVKLRADNIALNEVIVKASRFVRQEDKVLILPDKQQVKHAGTGYDLLYNLMIPGIDVDRREGKVKTFGGDVTLYIDGRKVDYREIQSLRPKDVERIEYFDVPTGKYAGDVAAINYIIRKYKAGGYISLDGKQTIGYLDGDYNLVTKLAYGATNYTFLGGYNMTKYDGTKTNGEELFRLSGRSIQRLTSTLDGNTESNKQYAQLNVENRNDKRTLLGKFSFIRNDQPDDYSREYLEYRKGYQMTQESEEKTAQRGLMPSVNLYGSFNLKNNQYIETIITGTYTNNDYSYSYKENDYATFNRSKEDLYSLFGKVSYGIKLKHKNSLTGQFYHMHNISMSDYSGDTNTWQHLWTGESLFFVEYSQSLGKDLTLKVAPGFSYLRYKLHGSQLIKQLSPRLQTRMVYRLADNQQLQWTGNIGNTFPEISMMNNVTQSVDSLQMKRGNPALTPAKLYVTGLIYGLQVGRFNMQSMINYTRGKNVTTQFYYEENGKLVKSYASNNNLDLWQAYLSLSYKLTNNFRFKLDGSWMNLNCRGNIHEKFNSLSGGAQFDYYLKGFAFSLYGKSKNKQMEPDLIRITMPTRYGLSISYNQGNLHVEAGTENPFTRKSRQIYETTQDIYQFRNNITCRTYQQTAYVKLAYTFDFGKKTSRDSNPVDRSINSAILKAR